MTVMISFIGGMVHKPSMTPARPRSVGALAGLFPSSARMLWGRPLHQGTTLGRPDSRDGRKIRPRNSIAWRSSCPSSKPLHTRPAKRDCASSRSPAATSRNARDRPYGWRHTWRGGNPHARPPHQDFTAGRAGETRARPGAPAPRSQPDRGRATYRARPTASEYAHGSRWRALLDKLNPDRTADEQDAPRRRV